MYHPDANTYLPDPYLDAGGGYYGASHTKQGSGNVISVTAQMTGSPGWLQEKAAEVPGERLQTVGPDAQNGQSHVVTVSAPDAVGIIAEQWNAPSKVGNMWAGDPIGGIRKIAPGMWQFYTLARRRESGPEGASGQLNIPIGAAFITVTAYYADGAQKTVPNRLMNQDDCGKAAPFCSRVGLRIEDGAIRPRIVASNLLPSKPMIITPPPPGESRALPGRTVKQWGAYEPTGMSTTGNGNGTDTGNGNGEGLPTWWDELPLAARAGAGAVVGIGGAWLLFSILKR